MEPDLDEWFAGLSDEQKAVLMRQKERWDVVQADLAAALVKQAEALYLVCLADDAGPASPDHSGS